MFKRIYLSDKQCEYLAKGIALGIAIYQIILCSRRSARDYNITYLLYNKKVGKHL